MIKSNEGYSVRIAIILVCLVVLTSSGAYGITFGHGERVHISNVHQINDDLYAFASSVAIEGNINGDLFAGGADVSSDGHVTGSENIFAYDFHHTGKTGGSIRAFANRCTIDGQVGRSLLIFANHMRLGSRATIRRDVLARGNQVAIDGVIMGDLDIEASSINITGQIDGDIKLKADEIIISPPAVIRGNLTYTCDTEIKNIPAEGVTVLGKIDWQLPKEETLEEDDEEFSVKVILTLSKMLAAFLFGIILIKLFSTHAHETFRQLRTRFSVAIAAGFLTLFICLFSLVVLVLSFVLIVVGLSIVSGEMAPLGALMLIFSILMVPITGFAGVSGGILFYSGKIVLAMLLGFLLIRAFKSEPANLGKGQLFLGLIVLTALFSIPFVGFVIYLLASIIGAGAIVLGIRNCHNQNNHSNSQVTQSKMED
ncbi:MAG: hypothetical protein U9R56_08235 [candidate division Zixibacteria bacterium]|nr:hypothetical protein [candidate division Zixibacteria bacterium]